MPAAAVVHDFIAAVEAGQFVEAIQRYYAEGASMQENNDAPRVGLAALVANEQRVMSLFKQLRGKSLAPPAISGDRVAINWAFDFTRADGSAVRLEEIAWQRWEGDKVVEERFFYDPRQLAPA